jgi:hypothetical protein
MVGCELPDGIRLVYTDDRGRRHAITLVEARAVDFGQTRSFRAPPAYRGQRNFPGWWWSVTTRSHVVYESWLGRHHIIEADRDARVTGISGQPFALTWASGKRQVWHTPDLYCRMSMARVSSPTVAPPTESTSTSGTSAQLSLLRARRSAGNSASSASRTRSGLPTCGGWLGTVIPGSPTRNWRSTSSNPSLSQNRWAKQPGRRAIRSGSCLSCST